MRAAPFLLIGLMLAISGCAALSDAVNTGAPQKGQMLGARKGGPISPEELAALVDHASLVIVGETHHHPGHHALQLEILKLMTQKGAKPVVGVEWLEAQAQPACDKLSRGEISVERFAKEVDWKNRWGYSLKLYAPILEEVRARGLKLVALNAPREIVRDIAHNGLDSLSREQRSRIAPRLDLDDQAYRSFVAMQFAGHGVHGDKMQKNFLAAQIARDETMARNMARGLSPWPDGGKRGILFCGSGHMSHGLGLTPRLARRLPGADILTVLPVSINRLVQASWPPEPEQYPAKVLVVTGPEPRRPHGRARLGVMLKPTEDGLLVERVMPGSPAEKAGVKRGDLLKALDSKPLRNVMDIHRGLRNSPHERHNYSIERNGRRFDLAITLPKPGGP